MNSVTFDIVKLYDPAKCVVFRRARDQWGCFSNMANGFPLEVGPHLIPSSEALYQLCRYPLLPEVQQEIAGTNNAFNSKLIARKYAEKTRADWHIIKDEIMRWCVSVKFDQHFETFGHTLLQTIDREIVEFSRKDDYWGAMPVGTFGMLLGKNKLGKILQQIRDDYILNGRAYLRNPPNVNGLLIFGKEPD